MQDMEFKIVVYRACLGLTRCMCVWVGGGVVGVLCIVRDYNVEGGHMGGDGDM